MWSRAQEIEEKMETDFSFLLICFKTYDQILLTNPGEIIGYMAISVLCCPLVLDHSRHFNMLRLAFSGRSNGHRQAGVCARILGGSAL